MSIERLAAFWRRKKQPAAPPEVLTFQRPRFDVKPGPEGTVQITEGDETFAMSAADACDLAMFNLEIAQRVLEAVRDAGREST